MRSVALFALGAVLLGAIAAAPAAQAQRLLENLDRGVVAIHQPDGRVFISWRLLGTDAPGVAFNVYRRTGARPGETQDIGPFGSRREASVGVVKLNAEPLTGATWILDDNANLSRPTQYYVSPLIDGQEGEPGAAFTLPANAAPLPYVSIPLKTPADYTPNDASLGDLDGDGRYEIIVKQERNPVDNSRSGVTGETRLQAYQIDGRFMWEINLGKNIREGAHYTQFLVFDFDGDGRAEIACKTADGTTDGRGNIIGDPLADHVRRDGSRPGYILKGPEFLTVFDGLTGGALSTIKYNPPRHPESENPTSEQMNALWGDGYGNRQDRFLAGVAYLDGKRPSLVMCRGYYTRAVLAAYDWRDGKLTERWVFDSDTSDENRKYRGEGNHQLSVADVDGDGRDEIVYGACVIDDDGKGLYATGWGHGDALHVSDLVPDNPGLEVFDIQEKFAGEGMSMREAKSGKPLWVVPSVRAAEEGGDRGEGPGRGNSFNIDPRHPGSESWAAGAGMDGLRNAKGEVILDKRPRGFPCNFAVWWDGDLLRELLDQNAVTKWNWETKELDPLLVAHACSSNNGTKATPAVSADLWGDWREEVIWRTRDNQELRIYTSTIPTKHRLVTLMHDAQYRVAIAWQNVAYNQPPHPSFYLDESAPLPVAVKIEVPAATTAVAPKR